MFTFCFCWVVVNIMRREQKVSNFGFMLIITMAFDIIFIALILDRI